MQYQPEEDEFADDGFDDLPVNDLHQLENDAIALSQSHGGHPSASRYRQPPMSHHALQRGRAVAADWQTVDEDQEMTAPPSSDYGLDDDLEDVVDLNNPHFVNESMTVAGDGDVSHTVNGYGAHDNQSQPYQAVGEALPTMRAPDLDWGGLQARVRQLEQQQLALQRTLEEAKSDAQSKSGQISILRSKHDVATQEYERKLSVMQKLHAEESAKHRAEIEAARKDQETIKTSNKFLEHDLAQEMEKSKRLRKDGVNTSRNDAGRARTENVTTPRKTQTLAFRDGFEDHEIMVVSPSKTKEKDKNKDGTPKAGGKRKRQVEGSPSIPLVMTPHESPGITHIQPDAEEPIVPNHKESDSQEASIRTMQRVLDHTPMAGHPTTLEVLTNYRFPDTPNVSLSNLLLQDLSRCQTNTDVPVSVQVCSSCMNLWSRCLSTGYYEPLSFILHLFDFVVISESSKIYSLLVERFIPLAIKSIDLIAVPRAKSLSNPTYAASLNKEAHKKVEAGIDDNLIVSLLHTFAISASASPPITQMFWRNMEFDFVLLMLNKAQPLPQIILMLQMVASSVLNDFFGAENAAPERQVGDEASTVDRLTSLFFEKPEAPADEDRYTASELAELRVEILRALGSICSTEHGSKALAEHRTVVGRLIRFLEIQVSSLPLIPPRQQSASGPSEVSLHQWTMTSINLTTRLLYHLIHTHQETMNLRDKLAVIHGGHHKFLVAFSRLAFSEQLVLEAGLDDEVVDAAHEILDGVLTLEEGEAVVRAVETPRGTTSTRVSVQPMASAPR